MACAGAAAALAGLVFVAVSINIQRILQFDGLPERALATVVLLLGVLVVSAFGLAPGQSRTTLGVELLLEGLAVCAVVGSLVFRSLVPRTARGAGEPRSWIVSRLILIVPGTVPFVVGGASMIAGAGGGLYLILAGMIGAFVGAVGNAWVLLVEILR